MSDARSLTPLSETDYEAIAAAVMETARGRWFMAEFAKRNRQADTEQVLARSAGCSARSALAQPQPAPSSPNLREAIALIMDLRADLERISGEADEPSSGLAARIERRGRQHHQRDGKHPGGGLGPARGRRERGAVRRARPARDRDLRRDRDRRGHRAADRQDRRHDRHARQQPARLRRGRA